MKFVEWFGQRKVVKLNEIDRFSSQNNFSPLKLKLLPYFLCTANGNREAMFSIFDSFYADKDGYIENDLSEFLVEGNDLLGVFRIEKNRLKIINIELLQNGLFEFNKETNSIYLCNNAFIKKFVLADNFKRTSEILTERDLLGHITHSIESLRKQDYYNEGGILDISDDKLSELSKIHFMYKLHTKNIAKYEKIEDKEKIKIEYLLTEKSIFGGKSENRIHTPLFELMHTK